ncbi:hypothetical protein O9993_10085 [Vibrio lentus]|nr:hypothetical protein [Vibrio lentus]
MNFSTDEQRDDLALAIKKLTSRYDNLFQCSFFILAGLALMRRSLKKAPTSTIGNCIAFFYPPLRSASVCKFMVGYEMLAESQRDLTAETSGATSS